MPFPESSFIEFSAKDRTGDFSHSSDRCTLQCLNFPNMNKVVQVYKMMLTPVTVKE